MAGIATPHHSPAMARRGAFVEHASPSPKENVFPRQGSSRGGTRDALAPLRAQSLKN